MADQTEAVLAKLLHKELYVVITEPLHTPEIAAKLHEHLQGQIALEREGIMFGAGPLQDEGKDKPTRGMWIIRAKSFADAHAIVARDIFHKSGLRTYKLYKWQMNEGSLTLTVNFSDQTAKIV
ncbi:MAG TPA: YciI family protein [Stellaceae bacterium]|nr:YciI family protein [Stellaceae bacterium]